MKPGAIKSIAVFCGSSSGNDIKIEADCRVLAKTLFNYDISLVYGGGNIGLMGIIADEMLLFGGQVIGVIPERLVSIELAHNNLTKLHIVEGMHERKAMMANLADAFLVLPGGIGTMEEFFEIYTWMQLGYHNKPIAISNVNGFYDELILLLQKFIKTQFVRPDQLENLLIADNSQEAVNLLLNNSYDLKEVI